MHVAVDAVNVPRDRRGIGRYARAVLQRWLQRPREQIRITLLVPNAWLFAAKRKLAKALNNDDVSVRRRRDVASLHPDLVWYPWNGMTWISPCVNVATVHDVWPFVSPAEDLRTRQREQTSYRTTATQAQGIIANSNFTKSEIVKYLSVPPERVHVVYMGVDTPPKVRDGDIELDGARRYVLFVGESEARKDPATLQTAMAKLPDVLRMQTGLVMAGKATGAVVECGRVEDKRQASRHCYTLRFAREGSVPTLVTGEVGDALLQQLYARAAAFVFPSRYEGFGLPVLEAMAHGIPVVASNAASVPEAGGDAALYFPAGDSDALASTLTRALSDDALAGRLAQAGRVRAAALSWDRCADETLRVFELIAARSNDET